MRTRLAIVVVGAVVASLAACSGSPKATPSTTTSTSRTSSTTATATATASATSGQGKAPSAAIPTSVANDVTARRHATLDRSQCTAVPGGWHAGGTVTNAGRTPTAYRLTVFFTSSHATVLSYAQTTVKVDAGKTEKWSVSSTFAAPKSVICVLRGVATG